MISAGSSGTLSQLFIENLELGRWCYSKEPSNIALEIDGKSVHCSEVVVSYMARRHAGGAFVRRKGDVDSRSVESLLPSTVAFKGFTKVTTPCDEGFLKLLPS